VTRISLTRASPHGLQHYGEATRRSVQDIAEALESLFWVERSGQTSPAWAVALDRLFALWCEQSGVVPPDKALDLIRDHDESRVAALTRAVRDQLGFSGANVESALADYMATLRAGVVGRRRGRAERDLLRSLYREASNALCVQSGHVTLARAVLYRVLEDKQLAGERISGAALVGTLARLTQGLVGSTPTPAVRLLEDMRRDTENFLPLLYGLRELDWWQIPTPREDAQELLFHQFLQPVEVALQRLLRLLDGYDFSKVDHDVWKDIYQYHLPWDERQRLGSFYTPDALVDLALDAAGWEPGGLLAIDQLTIADLSCGSGAFLVEALRRRRVAMEHRGTNRLGAQPTPQQLDELMKGIVGLDIHPFATFLASVNLVFQVIDLYDSVRHRHPNYSLPLNVFTVDSLEDAGAHPRQAALQAELPEDIRIRHTEQEIARYRELRTTSFDVVVGNPPWGGLLKGRLSPLNDVQKRTEYRADRRFQAATGKFDIYVLFIERSLRWLKAGGRYALVVPNTYLDKDFGSGVRAMLAEMGPPREIVDLGPYGTLYFNAMNTPSLVAGIRGAQDPTVRVVTFSSDYVFKGTDRETRQIEIANEARAGLAGHATRHGVSSYVETSDVLASEGHPWFLDPLSARRKDVQTSGDLTAGSVFEPAQGVTPAGEGVLRLLRFSKDEAKDRELDDELVHPAVGGLDVQRWALAPSGKVIVYPYAKNAGDDKWCPAFTVGGGASGTWDALADRARTKDEERLTRGLQDDEARRRLVTRRIADGVCPYPQVALYLLEHYERLAGRRNKGRPFGDFGRHWYEFLWPRNPAIMLASPKIIGRRYVQWPTYALDEQGVIPSDKCVALWRPTRRSGQMGCLVRSLQSVLGRPVTEREVMVYALAFLNSSASAFVLRVGRKPTAKGNWTVTEDAISWIPIHVSSDVTVEILERAHECVQAAKAHQVDRALEIALDDLVLGCLQLKRTTKDEIKAWAAKSRPLS
jgi:hypothetical protein